MTLLRSEQRWQRKLLVVYCLVSLVVSGCTQRRVVIHSASGAAGIEKAKSPYKEVKPATIGKTLQLVYGSSEHDRPDSQHREGSTSSADSGLDKLRGQIASDPSDLKARRDLIDALMELGLYLEALSSLRNLQQLSPDDPAVQIALARAWASLGDPEQASKHARQAIEMDPANPEGFFLAGQSLLEQDQPVPALLMLQQSLAIDPNNATTLAELARGCLKTQQWREASQYLTLALVKAPASKERRKDLAFALAHMGRQQEALDQYLKLYSEEDALTQLGNVLMMQKRWAEAQKVFETVLDLKPTHAEARLNLFEAESYMPIPAVVTIPNFKELASHSREIQSDSPHPALVALNEELTELPLDQLPKEGSLSFSPIQPWAEVEAAPPMEYAELIKETEQTREPIETPTASLLEQSVVGLHQVVMTSSRTETATQRDYQKPIASEPVADAGDPVMIVPTLTLRSSQLSTGRVTPVEIDRTTGAANLPVSWATLPDFSILLPEVTLAESDSEPSETSGTNPALTVLELGSMPDRPGPDAENALVIPRTSLRAQTIPAFEPQSRTPQVARTAELLVATGEGDSFQETIVQHVFLPAWPKQQDSLETNLADMEGVPPSSPSDNPDELVPEPTTPTAEVARLVEPLRAAEMPLFLPLSARTLLGPTDTWMIPRFDPTWENADEKKSAALQTFEPNGEHSELVSVVLPQPGTELIGKPTPAEAAANPPIEAVPTVQEEEAVMPGTTDPVVATDVSESEAAAFAIPTEPRKPMRTVRSGHTTFWAALAASASGFLGLNGLSIFGMVLLGLFGLGVGILQRRSAAGWRQKA